MIMRYRERVLMNREEFHISDNAKCLTIKPIEGESMKVIVAWLEEVEEKIEVEEWIPRG